jgi:hypothetical protein
MKSNTHWNLTQPYINLQHLFGNLEVVFSLSGQRITGDRISDVILIEHAGVRYYVKRYYLAGKGLRRFFGRPRIQGEWQNLLFFSQLGIPTADVVAYGYERKLGLFHRGAMITREIPNTQDMAALARNQDAKLRDPVWVKTISTQLANITRTLHQHRFIHNDLKWRNVLVDDHDKVYLIDCPLGDFWRGRLLRYRIIKDIKALDHLAKQYLSRTQRLAFYKAYAGVDKLTVDNKKFISEMLLRKSRRYDN